MFAARKFQPPSSSQLAHQEIRIPASCTRTLIIADAPQRPSAQMSLPHVLIHDTSALKRHEGLLAVLFPNPRRTRSLYPLIRPSTLDLEIATTVSWKFHIQKQLTSHLISGLMSCFVARYLHYLRAAIVANFAYLGQPSNLPRLLVPACTYLRSSRVDS